MLYLPPRYAHDGIAETAVSAEGKAVDCMTYSIGFRSPGRGELAAELLQRLAEFNEDDGKSDASAGRRAKTPEIYRDPGQDATATPAALPVDLAAFARQAVQDALKDPLALACALGEYMTEPKPSVWFDEVVDEWDGDAARAGRAAIRLDARTRMMYDADHIFINGESYRAKGADATLMRRLADGRGLAPHELRKAGASAMALLEDWHEAGWLRQESAADF